MAIVTVERTVLVSNNDQVIKMRKWCKENSISFSFYTDEVYGAFCIFTFHNTADIMAFKLRWM